MSDDRELLELAIKNAGLDTRYLAMFDGTDKPEACWNPLASSGDALRLAAMLDLTICTHDQGIHVSYIGEILASAMGCGADIGEKMMIIRRTIVRAAACPAMTPTNRVLNAAMRGVKQ